MHMAENVKFHPLKDMDLLTALGKDGKHAFMSSIIGRGMEMGPPELFFFPSNASSDRLLCIKGNSTSNGTHNHYAFVYSEALPEDAVLLPGNSLISENCYDFSNPWHALSNLVPFFYWRIHHECAVTKRLSLFHLGEVRVSIGSYIKNILQATGLFSEIKSLSYHGRPVCFEKAVVSRMGLHRIKTEIMFDIFREIRCASRRMCRVRPAITGSSSKKRLTVTLVVRSGGRAFVNESAWTDVIKSQCNTLKDHNCEWSVMYVSNLTFCQQVEAMSKTDILVSAHGAQLSSMMFMNPGGRVMEMFPKGWLELAGPGQHVYRNLAPMVGLKYEGSWRDPTTPACPYPGDKSKCMAFYKNQNIGLNATFIAGWLGKVIHDSQRSATDLSMILNRELDACKCPS